MYYADKVWFEPNLSAVNHAYSRKAAFAMWLDGFHMQPTGPKFCSEPFPSFGGGLQLGDQIVKCSGLEVCCLEL